MFTEDWGTTGRAAVVFEAAFDAGLIAYKAARDGGADHIAALAARDEARRIVANETRARFSAPEVYPLDWALRPEEE